MQKFWQKLVGITIAVGVAVGGVFLFTHTLRAADSTNYIIGQEGAGAIYQPMDSTNYQLDGSIGDPGVGQSTSTNYIIDHGFTWTGADAVVCGDGAVGGSEQCDDGNVTAGDGCSASCQTEGTGITTICGNGVQETGEACDDGNLTNGDGCSSSCSVTTQCNDGVDNDGDSLIDYPADAGCSSSSDNDETAVSTCGNGLINDGEQCDYGVLNSDTGACLTSCQLAQCGDSHVQSSVEACDDGNTVNTDTCTASCQVAVCGDGIVRSGVEACDDGNLTDGDGCSASCSVTTQCSDGVDNDGDSLIDLADPHCTDVADNSETAGAAVCGDGSVGGSEQCDDGNTTNGDGCSSLCSVTTQCSDSVDNDGDGAIDSNDSDCANAADDSEFSLALCGNGTVNAGEECDDGNIVSGDGCSAQCLIESATCGDDLRQGSEQCDDGNTANGDGCSALCRWEVAGYCGDGIVGDAEQCDDGNTANGDGCTTTCQTELIVPPGCAYNNPPCGSGFICINNACQPQEQSVGCAYSNPACGAGFVCVDNACQPIPPDEQNIEPPVIVATTTTIITAVDTINEVVTEQLTAITDRLAAVPAVQTINRLVLNNPNVETATERLIIPTLITVNIINTATVLPALGFLPYLSFIFTEPLHFLFWRRRKYGVVYNSITKQPLDLSAVRVYNAETNRLAGTRVTDMKGRYSFVGEPGQYYVKVQKANYQFPSSTLGKNIRDGEYADLYYGAPVTLTDQDNTLALNIPLDPDFAVKPDKQVIRDHYRRKLQRTLSFLGPILAVAALIIVPGWFQVLMVCTHTALFILFRRLTATYRPKSYGSIFDAHTKAAVKRSVVRIFDTQYNKLLATQVVTSGGKYNFLVGPNTYYLTASQQQYHPYRSATLDYRQSAENIIDLDVGLQQSNTPRTLEPPAPHSPVIVPSSQPTPATPPPVTPAQSVPAVPAPPLPPSPTQPLDSSQPKVAPPVPAPSVPPAANVHPDSVAEAMASYSVAAPSTVVPEPPPISLPVNTPSTTEQPPESNTQAPPPEQKNVV